MDCEILYEIQINQDGSSTIIIFDDQTKVSCYGVEYTIITEENHPTIVIDEEKPHAVSDLEITENDSAVEINSSNSLVDSDLDSNTNIADMNQDQLIQYFHEMNKNLLTLVQENQNTINKLLD